MLNFIAIDLQL